MCQHLRYIHAFAAIDKQTDRCIRVMTAAAAAAKTPGRPRGERIRKRAPYIYPLTTSYTREIVVVVAAAAVVAAHLRPSLAFMV